MVEHIIIKYWPTIGINHDVEKAAKKLIIIIKLHTEEENWKRREKEYILKMEKFYRIVCWKEQVWE